MAWIGGLSEGRKVAALAEAFDRPIAPHDCTGPVTLCANLHLTLAAPNALILETVRAYTRGFYRDLVTTLPRIEQGYAYPLSAPASARRCSRTSEAARMPPSAAAPSKIRTAASGTGAASGPPPPTPPHWRPGLDFI